MFFPLRAEGLAAELKDLQGQLADYNMVNSCYIHKNFTPLVFVNCHWAAAWVPSYWTLQATVDTVLCLQVLTVADLVSMMTYSGITEVCNQSFLYLVKNFKRLYVV